MQSQLSGFYKHTISERYQILKTMGWTDRTLPLLPLERAQEMIENVLGVYGIPMGIATNFMINDRPYLIPMVVEEPSVIAAASNAAKILGNIDSCTLEKSLVGQMIFTDLQAPQDLVSYIEIHEPDLIDQANQLSPSMVKRGGGARHFDVEVFQSEDQESLVTVYLTFDPCQAMGANSINTVLEGLAPRLADVGNGRCLMAILSNYQEEALTQTSVKVAIHQLDDDLERAHQIARDIALASQYAQLDPYRATTHNKGVMNGIDAVLLATGNDWRAVEAGAHAYVTRQGHYQAMTQWQVEGSYLLGQLCLPIQVATVGGAISVHPASRWSLDLLQHPSAKELSQIIGAVGLAQNFAALKALVSDGIQKGHMRMQYRNLAIQEGAQPHEVSDMVQLLQARDMVNSEIARECLTYLRETR